MDKHLRLSLQDISTPEGPQLWSAV